MLGERNSDLQQLGCRHRGGKEGREGGKERDRGREHLSRLQHVLKAHSQPDATIYSEIEGKKTECQKEKNMMKCRQRGSARRRRE